jgi:hypothetical protein
MDLASGHNSKVGATFSASKLSTDSEQFARNEFEAEAGGPPDSFQAPSESKEVYQNGKEIKCKPSQSHDWSPFTPSQDGSPKSDEGPFAHHCAMNAVIWKFYMEQARIFNEHLANSLNGDLDPLLIFVRSNLSSNRF